jgi:hypothetical protein
VIIRKLQRSSMEGEKGRKKIKEGIFTKFLGRWVEWD